MELSEIQRIREEHMRLFGGDSRPLHRHNTRSTTKSRNMSTEEVEYHEHANAVRSFASSVLALRCSACGHRISVEKGDIFPSFGSQITEIHASCKCCYAATCLGCKQTLTGRTAMLGNSATNGRHLTWHCDGARLVLIWALLFGYDDQMHRSKQTKKAISKSSKKKATYFAANGVGYSGDYEDDYYPNPNQYAVDEDSVTYPAGHLTFDGSTEDSQASANAFNYPGVIQSKAKQNNQTPSRANVEPDDEPASQLLAALVALFPSSSEQPIPTEFDFKPPSFLLSLLACSSIQDKAAELLRNNSLQDVMKRSALYNNLFAFIRVLANSGPAMSAVLHKPRLIRKSGHDLSKTSYAAPPYEAMDKSHPLSYCVKDLIRQSEQLLQNAAQHEEYYLDEESQQMLWMCINIREVGELLGKTNTYSQQQFNIPEDPHAWQDGLQVAAVSDEQIFNQHQYAKEAQSFSQAARGRMRHLISEVQMLEAGLPRNIFVRYGESRMDVMKVVIAGPVGSPYEHGLFEFDLLCLPEYPQVAPKMYFRTTGGGTVLFNPNLYQTGYVCLSLLGTWSGEPWQPGKSTLLQVLVSLQGMVFCEEPWCNEPGRESARGSDLSKQFNRNLWPNVVRYGMLEWIEGKKTAMPKPPAPSRWDAIPGMPGGPPPVTYTPPAGYNSPLAYVSPSTYPSTPSHPSSASWPPAQWYPSVQSYQSHAQPPMNAAPAYPTAQPPGLSTSYNLPKAALTTQDNGVFTEVAKKYFEANSKDIVNTVKRWIEERDRHSTCLPGAKTPPSGYIPPDGFGLNYKPPQKKKKTFGDTAQDSFGYRSPAIPQPPAKKIDRLPMGASLQQYLTAALEDLGTASRAYGVPGAWQ